MKLLIPTLNKIIRNQGTYFAGIMNNRLKIISAYGAILKCMGGIFQKKNFSLRDKNFLGQKNHREVVLHRRTNDHIMTVFGRIFINDK